MVDYTGKQSEGFKVIKLISKGLYLCKCICGNVVTINQSQIQGGKKDCGCRKNALYKHRDWTNKKVNMLTVLKPLEKIKDKEGRLWLCRCECGKEAEISSWDLSRGKKSCGCWQGNPVEISSAKHLYSQYRHGCFRRNRQISFTITEEEFYRLIKSNCYYCGSEPSQKMGHYKVIKDKITHKKHSEVIYYLIYNGIDRLNNLKGYETGNVVPCCKICNRMKFDLTQEKFVEHLTKIFRNAPSFRTLLSNLK